MKTTEQINPPTAPGLYQRRWQSGPAFMREWIDEEIVEIEGELFVAREGRVEGGGTPLVEFTYAEWRKKGEIMEENKDPKPVVKAKPAKAASIKRTRRPRGKIRDLELRMRLVVATLEELRGMDLASSEADSRHSLLCDYIEALATGQNLDEFYRVQLRLPAVP